MKRPAFTLFEVVLVLAIIVIVAAIGWPSIESVQDEFRVNAGVDQVRGAWAEARARAAEDNIPYRFAVMPDSGQYRIAPDAGEFWGMGDNASSMETDTPPLVHEATLPSGVVFSNADGGGGGGGEWQTVATFLSDGSARSDVEVFLRAPNARAAIIRMRGLTAAVSVAREGS